MFRPPDSTTHGEKSGLVNRWDKTGLIGGGTKHAEGFAEVSDKGTQDL